MTRLDLIDVPAAPARRLGLYTPAPSPPLRLFADADLRAAVDKVLASLPEDRWAVELDVDGDDEGVQIVGAIKSDNGWSLIGAASYVYGGKWAGHVAVRKEWR